MLDVSKVVAVELFVCFRVEARCYLFDDLLVAVVAVFVAVVDCLFEVYPSDEE